MKKDGISLLKRIKDANKLYKEVIEEPKIHKKKSIKLIIISTIIIILIIVDIFIKIGGFL